MEEPAVEPRCFYVLANNMIDLQLHAVGRDFGKDQRKGVLLLINLIVVQVPILSQIKFGEYLPRHATEKMCPLVYLILSMGPPRIPLLL